MSTVKWRSLPVEFKGERSYLQSANVWDSLAAFLTGEDFSGDAKFSAADAVLDIVFKKMMTGKIEFCLAEGRPPKVEDMSAQIILTAADGSKMMGLIRETGAPETGRFDDIENSFKPDVSLEEDAAEYNGDMPVSTSQMFVAIIKFWHQAKISNDVKWLATRLQLPLSFITAAPKAVRADIGTILKEGAGSISTVKASGAKPDTGRIYFFKT